MHKSKGFTLIEILVVIAIIVILVGIIIVAGDSAKRIARDNQRRTDIKLLQLKLESYKGDNGGLYPVSLSDLSPNYISAATLPKDPSGSGYKYTPLQFSGGASCGVSYYLRADLENTNPDYSSVNPINSALVACAGHINYSTYNVSPDYARTVNTYDVVSPASLQ